MQEAYFFAYLSGAFLTVLLIFIPAAVYLLFLSYKYLQNIEKILSLHAKYLYDINNKFPDLDLSELDKKS